MNSISSVIADLLEQFKGKTNIQALCEVLDRQIKDLTDAFDDIQNATSLETAHGQQLDRIGEIVGLTRAEASLLCNYKIDFIMNDERYRKYLKYKAFSASNGGTYSDLINAIQMVWGDSGEIKYIEDESFPATIILELSSGNDETLHLGDIPPIKPAGVTIEYKTNIKRKIRITHEIHSYISGIACGTHFCGTYPPKR